MNQIKLPYMHTKEDLYQAVARILGGSVNDLKKVQIVKESIDARKKPQIFKVYTVDVALKKEKAFAAKIKKLKLLEIDILMLLKSFSINFMVLT